jgi:RNA polymerase sigma-70 factor, ECF subfamily
VTQRSDDRPSAGDLQGLADHDDVHLREWYCAHHDRLVKQSIRILGNSADAEDVVQEAFFQAWSRRRDIRHGEVGKWLTTVAHNLAVTHLRKSKRAVPGIADRPSDGTDPARLVEGLETHRAVLRAIEELSPERRKLVHSLVRDNGRFQGKDEGPLPGATRALLFRARRDLRRRLVAIGELAGTALLWARRRATGTRTDLGRFDMRAATSVSQLLQAGLSLTLAAGIALSNAASVAPASLSPSLGMIARPDLSELTQTHLSTPRKQRTLDHGLTAPNSSPQTRVAESDVSWQPGTRPGEGSIGAEADGPNGKKRRFQLFIRWEDSPDDRTYTFWLSDAVTGLICPTPGVCRNPN